MKEFVAIYVTVGSAEEAAGIARTLVDERLAACVNHVPGIRSTYRWQGQVEQESEELLIIKSRRDLLPALEKRVRELHSYELPEFIALPVLDGSFEYLQWLDGQLLSRGESTRPMREIRELSAGGIVFRRSGETVEVALIRTGKRWALPKGHLEGGESLQQAACREVLEETGLEGEVIAKLGDISYRFSNKRRAGEPVRIFKRVHFYLLRWTRGVVQGQDYEVDEARWFPLDDALTMLSYPTEKKMMNRAIAIIAGNQTASAARGRNEPSRRADRGDR